VAPDNMTEQWSRCNKTRACRTYLVDSGVKKAEQRFIMDRLLPILVTVVSTCFDHDITSTCSILLQYLVEV
jgi:hypothetical protein